MTLRPFQIVDVFGGSALTGNPLAVVAADDTLDADLMQRITRWLGFSETAFLLPPTDPAADYRVRIFTLARELPFAGHPTLGACHVWLGAGGVPRSEVIVQQCGAGLVRIRRPGDFLAFAAPPLIRSGPVDDVKLEEIADVLRIPVATIVASRWVDNGPGWVAVMLSSAEAVRAVRPARSHDARIDIGVVGLNPPGHPGGAACEVRALFSDDFGGIVEDPVTGSLNASVAQWLISDGVLTAPYEAAQGSQLGRDGRIQVNSDERGQVWIGGATRTIVSGEAGSWDK